MTPALTALVVAYAMVLIVWAARVVIVYRECRRMPLLTRQAPQLQDDILPRVSVLVPACNEEGMIAECLKSILTLDYPELEVIVIDDRSTDRTAEIVGELAEGDARVRLEQVRELPAGWTGKTHALHAGVQHATGEWLLFVDADTRHDPANLRVMLEYARRERADLVSLLPGLRSRSFWERVVQPLAAVLLMIFFRLPRVNSEQYPQSAFANGQYILIRRSAYDRVGGHGAVRSEFVEDIQLGRLVKQSGLRLRVALAPELTTTRMYTSLGEIIQGWSRIFYSALDRRPWKLLALVAALIALSLSAYFVPALAVAWLFLGYEPGAAWTLLGMSVLQHVLIAGTLAQLYALSRSHRGYILLYLPACLAMLAILLRAVRLCFTHRVTWRGTAYGPELRR